MARRNSDYKNYTVAELFKQFEDLESEGVQVFTARCHILNELAARGETHPKMGKGIYAYSEDICSGQLSGAAVFVLAGRDFILQKMRGMPLAQQNDIANGKVMLPVAEMNSAGDIVVNEKPVSRITPTVAEMVFTKGDIRSPEKQKQIVAEKEKLKQKAKVYALPHKSDIVEIIVNKSDNTVTVGKTTVDITILLKALVAGGVNVMMSKAA